MWDFGKEHQASAYPPSATQISQVNSGEDTKDVLVQKSTWFPKTPIRNFRQLNRFLSPAHQILSLKDVKHSMVVVTQLQQHIEPKANLAYKYVILFHVSILVMKSRKSRLQIAVGSKVSTKRIDIKFQNNVIIECDDLRRVFLFRGYITNHPKAFCFTSYASHVLPCLTFSYSLMSSRELAGFAR